MEMKPIFFLVSLFSPHVSRLSDFLQKHPSLLPSVTKRKKKSMTHRHPHPCYRIVLFFFLSNKWRVRYMEWQKNTCTRAHISTSRREKSAWLLKKGASFLCVSVCTFFLFYLFSSMSEVKVNSCWRHVYILFLVKRHHTALIINKYGRRTLLNWQRMT